MEYNWIHLIAHWVVSAVALLITAALVPGFRVRGFFAAMIAVVLIGAANYFIGPVLLFLTFPLTIITLGFFLFVVDAIILRLCAAVMDDFDISNWISAVIGAIILSISSGILHYLFV